VKREGDEVDRFFCRGFCRAFLTCAFPVVFLLHKLDLEGHLVAPGKGAGLAWPHRADAWRTGVERG